MDVASSSASHAASTRNPFLIGVAGGTASGKTTVCSKIMERLGSDYQRQLTSISCESFYRDLSENEIEKANQGKFNFDHPDSFDFKLMHEMLNALKEGKPVEIPKYDYINHCRHRSESIPISPVDVILVEGILVFYYKELRELFNMKLFVDTDPDTRLARRVLRDIGERGRGLENILHQYVNLVKPAFEEFCLPSKKYADVIIPRGGDNDVAIDLIVQHIQDILSRSPRSTPLDELDVPGDQYSRQVLNGRARTMSEGSGMSNDGPLVRPH